MTIQVSRCGSLAIAGWGPSVPTCSQRQMSGRSNGLAGGHRRRVTPGEERRIVSSDNERGYMYQRTQKHSTKELEEASASSSTSNHHRTGPNQSGDPFGQRSATEVSSPGRLGFAQQQFEPFGAWTQYFSEKRHGPESNPVVPPETSLLKADLFICLFEFLSLSESGEGLHRLFPEVSQNNNHESPRYSHSAQPRFNYHEVEHGLSIANGIHLWARSGTQARAFIQVEVRTFMVGLYAMTYIVFSISKKDNLNAYLGLFLFPTVQFQELSVLGFVASLRRTSAGCVCNARHRKSRYSC
ncbi:hypothetical protein B0H17DRAFT_1129484 [Mycena rosella]|uniref:Uncharacterized protein n=1 Tax=Mycena rosella TaxID=1033263 RepID=A0AAD7GQ06_MYCRO|nr:hypothetical protein B0H17DRAFT_1129484 [Mycena rosella]